MLTLSWSGSSRKFRRRKLAMNNNMKSRLAPGQPPIFCQVEEDLIEPDGDERQRERRE